MELKGKHILLGVTASISAYKVNYLVRFLVKAGAEVKVICTPASLEFVTPLTLSTLSKNPVLSSFTENEEEGTWNNHVELGQWADLFLIAPASANTIAKMANGICDNLLMAVYLSAKCPVWCAPAMDLDMYAHASTGRNLAQLSEDGVRVLEPKAGELASGLVGKGRLQEPEEIYNQVLAFFKKKSELTGLQALVTAGPTYEHIDPVRFVGNPSSGRMGIALAEALAAKGAQVTLICGPSGITSSKWVKRVNVISAKDMFDACSLHQQADIVCMAAAVADYTPVNTSDQKLKKGQGNLNVEFERTADILAHFGKNKKEKQVIVGFAMETNDEVANARKKLHNKNADLIVLNSLNEEGAGFKHATNRVIFVSEAGEKTHDLKNKSEVAKDIVEEVIKLRKDKK